MLKNDYSAAQPFRSSLMQKDFRAFRGASATGLPRSTLPTGTLPRFPAAAIEVEPFELYEGTAWTLVRATWLAHERGMHPSAPITESDVLFR